jgi:hypothetical protein
MEGEMLFDKLFDEANAALMPHQGHKIVIAKYGNDTAPISEISIECERCGEVLVTFPNE